jgi:hypothetical protein
MKSVSLVHDPSFKRQVILNRMREKAHRALEAARNIRPLDLPRAADGVALGMGIIKQEEIDDEFAVFAGRTKVFRPGATSSSAAQPALPMVMTNSCGGGDGQSPDEAQVGHAQVGEWLARQEPYVGYDPHPIEAASHPPLPVSHQQHHQQHQQHQQPHQHQHQHHQYHQQQYTTYAPEQPQYTLEAMNPIPQYMTTPYPYSQPCLVPPPPRPPYSSLSSSSTTTTTTTSALNRLRGSHVPPPPPHHQHQQHQLAELRSYAAVALAPQTELSELGLAANGSRVNETWMSFMHQHSGLLDGASAGGRHL